MLLAFSNDYYPNVDALAASPTIGWLLLTFVVALVAFFMAHREKWRRLWLSTMDPRSVAVFRIVFGLFTLFNVNGLWELFEYLFTDEGIFPTDVAQQVRARAQFAGYGEGGYEPAGFFDLQAVWAWVSGSNHSLLLFDSSPTAFWIQLAVFEVSMVMFIVGFQTKWVKWVAWFSFHSITLRNTLYWEGTENIYRCFLFYLALSRCGEAYSVDNWLRVRRLRREGRLSEVGGPGGGAGVPVSPACPQGLEPIYRSIPAWPRWLMMIQTAIVYGYAGPTKNGDVWRAGDAFYYAFNLDHFYRFPPQTMSAWFGTNLFRLNSHVVHYWQMFFPLVLVGLVLRWVRKEGFAPLEGHRRLLARTAWVVMCASMISIVLVALPFHHRPGKGVPSLEVARTLVAILAPLGLLALWAIVRRLDRKPPTLRWRGHSLRVDLDFAYRWLLGRRLWLGLGAIFHLHLIVMMNIGWFNPGLLASYLMFLQGPELAGLLRAGARALGRLVPAVARRARGRIVPPADPAAPTGRGARREAAQRRDWALAPSVMWTLIGLMLVGVVLHAWTDVPVANRLAHAFDDNMPGLGKLRTELEHPPINFGWFMLWGAVFLALAAHLDASRGRVFRAGAAPLLIAGVAAVGASFHFYETSWLWGIVPVFVVTLWGSRPVVEPDAAAIAAERRPATGPRKTPTRWAYGPMGRVFVGALAIHHLVALAAWMLPEKDSLGSFRDIASEPFRMWLQQTHTTQSWSMFAPNPPRSNLFMRVLVTDAKGEVWDLNTDVYACFQGDATAEICDSVYPIPWVSYSRQRKINRRIVGGEGGGGAWYQKWHARWVCRDWESTHGEVPEKVELIKVTYRIPRPNEVHRNGAYDPAVQYRKTASQSLVHTTHCATEPYGRLSPEQRARRGLEPLAEGEYRGWRKNRHRRWLKRDDAQD